MPHHFPRCQILPLADDQTSIQIDGVERLRWHYGANYTRPFFFPFLGPTGTSLTRIGHPGASNHDHHKSVWFAHNKVLGIDFWSETTSARIRQKEWLVYEDGDDEAIFATRLGWFDGHDPTELLEQLLITIVRPGPNGETFFELQTEFIPKSDSLEFQKTNFGFFAVRVAKNLSEHFGGGKLTNSEGLVGEKDAAGQPNIFGKQARWMDYSGPVPAPRAGVAPDLGERTEGITYFDHPSNPGYPSFWHVREDGWMGASPCMQGSLTTKKSASLRLRYLLHAHSGAIAPQRANEIAAAFAAGPTYEVIKGTRPHRQFEVRKK